MPTEEDCFHRQQGHSFELAKRSWFPSHGFKRKCKSKSARTISTSLRGSRSPRPCGQRASANDITFSEGQLNAIRQLVQDSVAAASREIAKEAALAAVQVLQPSSSQTASNPNRVTPAIEPVTPQQTASP